MKHSHAALLLMIAYLGFISLGLPDTLIGVAWPSLRQSFQLPQSAIALIFFGAGASYFLSSFFAGRLVQRLGIGMLLAGSSGLVVLSMLGYGSAPLWGLFAACSLLHGLGSGAIDAGLNYYVARHFSARHMSWLHACWGLGATLGPLIMTTSIALQGSWRTGYLVIASLLSLLALLFALTRRRWDAPDPSDENAAEGTVSTEPTPVRMSEALRHRAVQLQIALFFCYTGLESTVGQWSFSLLTESRQVPTALAGSWVTLFWASLCTGRIVFGAVSERLGLDRLLRLSTLTTVLGTALLKLQGPAWLTALALMITGLGLASIYPCLMTRTPERLGDSLAAHAIGFQVSAATLGAAGLPSLAGLLADHTGIEPVALFALGLALGVWLLHESLLRLPQSQRV